MNTVVPICRPPLHSRISTRDPARVESQRFAALRLRSSTFDERKAKINNSRCVIAHTRLLRRRLCRLQEAAAEVDITEISACDRGQGNRAHMRKWMKPARVMPTRATLGPQGLGAVPAQGRC